MKKKELIGTNIRLSISGVALLLCLFCCCASKYLSPWKIGKNTVHIFVAAWFEKDTLTLSLNETLLLDNVIVTSSLNTSETGHSFYISKSKKRGVYECVLGDRSSIMIPLKKREFTLTTILNGERQIFEFDADKGQYLLLNKEADLVEFKQTSRKPAFY